MAPLSKLQLVLTNSSALLLQNPISSHLILFHFPIAFAITASLSISPSTALSWASFSALGKPSSASHRRTGDRYTLLCQKHKNFQAKFSKEKSKFACFWRLHLQQEESPGLCH